MFQHSLEMLRKIRVQRDRSVTAPSDMKIRQREGERESPISSGSMPFQKYKVWCKAGCVWSGKVFVLKG